MIKIETETQLSDAETRTRKDAKNAYERERIARKKAEAAAKSEDASEIEPSADERAVLAEAASIASAEPKGPAENVCEPVDVAPEPDFSVSEPTAAEIADIDASLWKRVDLAATALAEKDAALADAGARYGANLADDPSRLSQVDVDVLKNNETRLSGEYASAGEAYSAAEGWSLKNFRVARVGANGGKPAHYVIYKKAEKNGKPAPKPVDPAKAEATATRAADKATAAAKRAAARAESQAAQQAARDKRAAEKPAKTPKTPKSDKPTKAPGQPRSGTDAEVILRQLTRPEGLTRKSIEGELEALRGKHIKISPRSTAQRFSETYGLDLVESADDDEAKTPRFRLVAKTSEASA